MAPIKTPKAEPAFEVKAQREYGFDEGETDFDLEEYPGPPPFEGVVMPPPPVPPPPANTFAYPPNFEAYARAHLMRWAQRVLLDEFGEAASRGGDDEPSSSSAGDEDESPDLGARAFESSESLPTVRHAKKTEGDAVATHDSTRWYERVQRVRASFDVVVNGAETTHRCDWSGPPPKEVARMLETEPIAAFASPALGMYHPEVRSIGHKAEDAALTAAVAYACEWAVVERQGAVLDPFRDIREMRFAFELVTRRGKRRVATRTHAGGPNDRMNAFNAAITRVRGW